MNGCALRAMAACLQKQDFFVSTVVERWQKSKPINVELAKKRGQIEKVEVEEGGQGWDGCGYVFVSMYFVFAMCSRDL
jgi:hypothetical protein